MAVEFFQTAKIELRRQISEIPPQAADAVFVIYADLRASPNKMNDITIHGTSKSLKINHLAQIPTIGIGRNSNQMNQLTQNPGYFPAPVLALAFTASAQNGRSSAFTASTVKIIRSATKSAPCIENSSNQNLAHCEFRKSRRINSQSGKQPKSGTYAEKPDLLNPAESGTYPQVSGFATKSLLTHPKPQD